MKENMFLVSLSPSPRGSVVRTAKVKEEEEEEKEACKGWEMLFSSSPTSSSSFYSDTHCCFYTFSSLFLTRCLLPSPPRCCHCARPERGRGEKGFLRGKKHKAQEAWETKL